MWFCRLLPTIGHSNLSPTTNTPLPDYPGLITQVYPVINRDAAFLNSTHDELQERQFAQIIWSLWTVHIVTQLSIGIYSSRWILLSYYNATNSLYPLTVMGHVLLYFFVANYKKSVAKKKEAFPCRNVYIEWNCFICAEMSESRKCDHRNQDRFEKHVNRRHRTPSVHIDGKCFWSFFYILIEI